MSEKKETQIFVKFHVEAVHSGLVAALGPDLWQTLSVIAAYIDAKGECFPSQDLLAHRLGISRAAVNVRIQRLLSFRWNEEQILSVRKERGEGGQFARNVYTVHAASGLSIF